MGFAIDDKKLKHAGLDYWHYLDISYYDSLDDFFSKNDGPFYYFTTKAPQRYTDVAYPDGAYLVSGGKMPVCRKRCWQLIRSTASGCPCGTPAAA